MLVVDIFGEPHELWAVCNLIETITVELHAVSYGIPVNEAAIVTNAIDHVVVVLSDFGEVVSKGIAFIEVAVAMLVSVHIDLCMSSVECGLLVCAQCLIPADDGLVALHIYLPFFCFIP